MSRKYLGSQRPQMTRRSVDHDPSLFAFMRCLGKKFGASSHDSIEETLEDRVEDGFDDALVEQSD